MTNADSLEKFNNLVDMVSSLKVRLRNQAIIDTVTEDKYLGGGYEIINPDKK